MKTPPKILFILLATVIIYPTTSAAYSSYLPQSPPQQPPPPPPPATTSLPAPTTTPMPPPRPPATPTSSPRPPATPTSSLPPAETPKWAPSSGGIPSILSNLGYHDLSTIDTTIAFPVTIFAPTDSSVRTCSSCSVRRLLLEHSIPGLYPLRFLRTLAFGTKIETLASSPTPLCLTLTKSTTNALDSTLFVNGVKITRPEVFNDGKVLVHGIQGFLAHLSPLSCQIERMTTLSFPSQPYSGTQAFIMRFLLKDALLRLRISGYSVLSLAMQEKFQELMNFNNMTVFALDDDAVFGDGHVYLSDLSFHIVPNQRIMAVDLLNLPAGKVLPTNERGEKLVVTEAGGGGLLTPMRINNVKIIRTDVVFNDGVVVHSVATPFPRVHQAGTAFWPDQMDDTDQTAEMK